AQPPDRGGDLARPDPDIGFIIGREAQLDVWAEHLAALAVDRQPIDRRQRIGRDIGPQPLYRVAIVIVMRWLDHDEVKQLHLPRLHEYPSEEVVLSPSRSTTVRRPQGERKRQDDFPSPLWGGLGWGSGDLAILGQLNFA